MPAYGRLPLPKDERDWLFRDVPPERLPEPTSTSEKFWSMVNRDFRLDQGQEGTCEGHAHTNLLTAGPSTHPDFADFATVDSAHQFARKLYLDATGDTTYQQGAYTRQVLNVLKTRGQISAYYRCASVDDIVHAVLTTGPVNLGSTWYYSMEVPKNAYNNAYIQVNEASGIAGGHIVCLTGVNLAPTYGPAYFRIENSWGAGWAHDGTARLTIDDAHILFTGDAFVVTEAAF